TGSGTALPAARATRALPAVRGQAVRVQRDQAGKFWAAVRGRKVWLDHRVTVALDQSVPQIGAPAAWKAGFDGTGVSVAVLDDGSGLDSWIMAGMEWAATNGAKVVSMSLGAEPTDGTDPVSEELNALTAQTGTLFVVAAGNTGTRVGVGSPGSATSALTVGAV